MNLDKHLASSQPQGNGAGGKPAHSWVKYAKLARIMELSANMEIDG